MLKKIGLASIAIISMIVIVGCSDKNEKENVEKSVVKKYTVKDMEKIGFKTSITPMLLAGMTDGRKGTIDGTNVKEFYIYESAETLDSLKDTFKEYPHCTKGNLLVMFKDKKDCSILERL